MPAPATGYTVVAKAVAVTSSAKTVAGVLAGASRPVRIAEIVVAADGTSGNLLVELVYGDNTSNPPGTNSSSFTVLKIRDGGDAVEATAGTAWTAEPTVLTAVKSWRFSLPGGPLVIQFPLGREPTGVKTASTSGKFIGVRITASVNCNADCTIEFEE